MSKPDYSWKHRRPQKIPQESLKVYYRATSFVGHMTAAMSKAGKEYRQTDCAEMRRLAYGTLYSIRDANEEELGSEKRPQYMEKAYTNIRHMQDLFPILHMNRIISVGQEGVLKLELDQLAEDFDRWVESDMKRLGITHTTKREH